VLDSATHYCCAKYKDGEACKNSNRVRRDVAGRVILGPITERLLAPDVVGATVKEMHRYYAQKAKASKADEAARPPREGDVRPQTRYPARCPRR
jgi:hypothetical protein